MKDIVIEVANLSKVYKLYDKPSNRLKESLSITKKIYHKQHYALKDINFNVNKGETIGIIGSNGSGKSTLLKIITGVLNPTQGEVNVVGRISALLELGAGFNPEYTGIENVYLNGTMLGFSKEEIDSKINDIIDFADIGYFINQPVKTYSSGMFVRLAFAVAINVQPDILIVDEALSVGDIRFQQKCYRKIEEFKKDKTVIMVSHDIGSITKFCDKVIWIEQGELQAIGDPITISKHYQAYLMQSKISHNINKNDEENIEIDEKYKLVDITEELEVYGDKRAEIIGVGLFDKNGANIETMLQGTEIRFIIKIKFNEDVVNPIVGFTVNDRLGNIIFQTNSYVLNQYLETNKKYRTYAFDFIMPELNQGIYTISPAIASGVQEEHIQHNWVHDAITFSVITKSTHGLQGLL